MIVNPPTGSSLGLDVTVPAFFVSPGRSVTQDITIQWQGATKIIINGIHFSKDQSWFTLGNTLPVVATMSGVDVSTKTSIPLTVTVPADVQGTTETVDMTVTAITGASQTTKVVPVTVTLGSTSDLAVYAGIGMVAVIAIAVVVKRRR